MAQILVPVSDEAAGSWTTTPLWSKVDDDSTQNPSGDGFTIASDAVGNNTQSSFADLQLTAGNDPAASTGHIIRARWHHDQSGRTMRATCELWQGVPGSGTLVATLQVDPDVGTTETESMYTLTGGEADSISDYSNLYVRMYGFGTGGGPARSLIVDLVELETPDATAPDAQGQVSWAELETPSPPRGAQVSWTEFETPDGPRQAQVSWTEVEVPTAPRQAQVSWTELEVDDAPRQSQVSWSELEVPDVPSDDKQGQISWAEFEAPDAPRQSQISWVELETPTAPRQGQVSWSELEVPAAPRMAAVSWTEFEVPTAPRQGQVSWAEFEAPPSDAQAQVSWAELEVPEFGESGSGLLLLGVR